MIDLSVSTEGMQELLYSPGARKPDFIFALRIAAMSANMPLAQTARLSRYLSQFTGMPLPYDRAVLYAGLSACKARVTRMHVRALYAIDLADQDGLLESYKTLPDGYNGQVAWRAGLVATIYGMAEKTISLAALILEPFKCELCAIDRWHMRRLGMPVHSLKTNAYLAIERQLKIERDDTGYSHVPLGLWSAWMWGNVRDGDSAYQGETTNHRALSCRWY